jgi:uncharacterized protein
MSQTQIFNPTLSEKNISLIETIAREIEPRFRGEASGHDWFHVERVRGMARRLAEKEDADAFVVELASLLHDVGDWKFNDGDETAGPREIHVLLAKHEVPEDIAARVVEIVATMGFKGGAARPPMTTIEGKVVQDADRLDAIGAIGIARTFAYGGHKGRVLHDPDIPPMTNFTKEQYLKNSGPTLNHFYEKLVKLRGLLNTDSARAVAEGRHAFLEEYLNRFLAEWDALDF